MNSPINKILIYCELPSDLILPFPGTSTSSIFYPWKLPSRRLKGATKAGVIVVCKKKQHIESMEIALEVRLRGAINAVVIVVCK